MLKSVFVPIHREGWPFVAGFTVASLAITWWFEPLGYIGAIVTAWCAYFFRNPERVTPVRSGLVISPADGVVESIVKATPPEELKMGDKSLIRVAIFMNIFNVHINRIPIDGEISAMNYKSGKFFNASLDKASIYNERQSLKITTGDGIDLAIVQIAGLVARRIRCWASVGCKMQAGERFGLIRFGSRVDVYLPEGIEPSVSEGQTMIAGESVLADLLAGESARKGEIR